MRFTTTITTAFLACSALVAARPSVAGPRIELSGTTDAELVNGVLVLYEPVNPSDPTSEEFKPVRYYSGYKPDASDSNGVQEAGKTGAGDDGMVQKRTDWGYLDWNPFTDNIKRSAADYEQFGHHLYFDRTTGQLKKAPKN